VVLTGSSRASRCVSSPRPSTAGDASVLIGTAIDGMPLAPTHLWVQASVTTLTLDHCISGRSAPRRQVRSSSSRHRQHHPGIDTGGGSTDYPSRPRSAMSRSPAAPFWAPVRSTRWTQRVLLDEVTIAEDTQHGCVRFSAIARERPARAVPVRHDAAEGPCSSPSFGEPNYAASCASRQRHNDPQTATRSSARPDGRKWGLPERGRHLKKRGLVLKFEDTRRLACSRCGSTPTDRRRTMNLWTESADMVAISKGHYDPTRQYAPSSPNRTVDAGGHNNESVMLESEALRLETIDIVGPAGTPTTATSQRRPALGSHYRPGIFYLEAGAGVDKRSTWRPNPTRSPRSRTFGAKAISSSFADHRTKRRRGGGSGAARGRAWRTRQRRALKADATISARSVDGDTCATGATAVPPCWGRSVTIVPIRCS